MVSTAANALTVTDTTTGSTDNFSYDGVGTVTVTTTNKQGAQIGTSSYNATGLGAVASQPPTTTLVDGSGKQILEPGSGQPITYDNAVSVNRTDQYDMTVTNTANGNVDTYSAQLDSNGNPIQNAQGDYLTTVTHTDSLGRTIGASQTLAATNPGLNALSTSNTSPITIAADGAGTTTAINNQTILPITQYTSPTGSNGNALSNVITDGSGNALATYTDPVSIAQDTTGNITVTDKKSGNIDTYTDNGDGTISIAHTDSAGDVIKAASTVNGSGLNALVAQTPTLSFVDGSGNAITASNGAAIPTYTNPVSVTNTSSGADTSYTVTDSVSGYVDTYDFNSGTGTLNIVRSDAKGDQLSTQTATGLNGFSIKSSAVTVTDSSGNTLTDTNGTAAPTYTDPVSFKDAGGGNFSITDSLTGNVDNYAYDSQAQTLSISHTDSSGNVLSTQNFTGVSGITKPWISMADSTSSSWTVTPPPATVTDASGNTLTDSNGNAAPSYEDPVTVSDSGGGNFSVTNNTTGYVDTYAYDSAAQTLNITEADNAGNTLATQSFSGVNGLTVPWAAQQAANPNTWSVTPTGVGVTDASGNTLTDSNGNAAPTYTSPVTVADSGSGNFSVTNNATGYVDTYAYDSAAQTLNITENDNAGNTLATQSFSGVNGLTLPWAAQQAANPTTWSVDAGATVTDASGNTLTDTNSNAAPTYTNPVTVSDSGNGNFAITDTVTGYVDTYAYDSAAQTLNITEDDNNGNTLATQSFTGVNGLTVPWAAQQAASPTTWSAAPTGIGITDASGNTLTDSNGQAAPTYDAPVTVADSGSGNFSVTNSLNGYVDTYAYDSAAQTLNITEADNAGNTLATQSFTGVNGLTVPWASQQAADPTSWNVSPTAVGVTDASGNTLTDSNGQAAPSYTDPVTVSDSGSGNFSVTNNNTGYVDTYAYDSAAQTLSITENDNAGNTLATQSFTGVNGLTVPWASQQAASPASWNVTATPVGITDSSGNTLTDSNGTAAPTYTDPISIKDSGGGKFAVTDTTTGYVDQYAYDSAAQTLSITHQDNSGNTLSTQNFTGVSGISGLNIPASSLQPATATNWDVFNQTTLNSKLTSLTGYSTSYDTSTFNLTNPASHTVTPGAYTSTTSLSYTNINVGDPSMMQSLLPNLQLNYVTTPKITVTPVTEVPMPTSVEASTPPYNIDAAQMPKWESDALGFMKAGTPFMLNFDQQGNLEAQQLTGANIIKFNNPSTTSTSSYNPYALTNTSNGLSGVALMLSTLA